MANESPAGKEEIVDGKYPIGAVIGRTARSTVYETQLEGGHTAAAIKVQEKSDDSEDRIGQWRSAMELAHPNLLRIYAAGSSTLNETAVNWAVMERAEESLDGVLPSRPLTAEEARAMLTAVTGALQYLHEKGYAHTRVSPSNVVAVGEQVKLSSDTVTRMEAGGSATEDMKALGTLIVQALTQQVPADDGDSKVVPATVPQPFREIAQHCLNPYPSMRWTAGQVLAKLTPPAIERPLPGHQLHMEKVPAPALEARTRVKHEEKPVGHAAPDEITKDQAASPRRIPNWIYAALTALILIVFMVAGLRKNDSVAHAEIPARRAQPAPPPRMSVPPPVVAERPAPRPVAPAAVAPVSQPPEAWTVIAAAYASREPAEKRVRQMAKKWPRFNPVVARPLTGKPLYIIVLGQNLSQDEAEALRKRAVAAGLPRDTYISKN
jgi:hypothetical protein